MELKPAQTPKRLRWFFCIVIAAQYDTIYLLVNWKRDSHEKRNPRSWGSHKSK